jgi:hypothetical protein
MRNEVMRQIKNITKIFIENNLSVYQKFPAFAGHNIVWDGFKDISFALQKEKYEVIYTECLKEKDFNILMLDGALIQFMYKFYRDNLLEHRLTFYPNPSIERFQDNPEVYEELYYGEKLFSEVFDEKVVCTPIRFDFNSDDNIHVDVDHAKSHLTIGNYTNCRIPVKAPLSPHRFIRFILRSFYREKFVSLFTDDTFKCDENLGETITGNEKKQVHMSWNYR